MKEFILQGLDCANCAAKIETSIKAIEDISYASLNFATSTLRVQAVDTYSDDLYKKVQEIVRGHEPDVLVLEKASA